MTYFDVSVIVPVYNTDKYLQECVESIICQTMIDRMEIILVDDGSTDRSPGICDSFAFEYKNMTVIHQKNGGVSAARNTGIDKARGKYIGFVDSDDTIFPEMVEKLFENAERTNADMSFCGFIHCLPDGETNIHYPFPENTALDRNFIQENVFTYLLKKESFNTCCNKLFKRQIIEQSAVYFRQERKIGEDRKFIIDFLAACGTICYTSFTGYYYRLVPTSAIQTPRTDYLEQFISQYYEDLTVFEALGVNRRIIEEYAGYKLLEQSLAGIYFAVNKLKGEERYKTVKSIVRNNEIRECLKTNRKGLMVESSKYEKLLYLMIRAKSVSGLRAVMLAMKIKTGLVR